MGRSRRLLGTTFDRFDRGDGSAWSLELVWANLHGRAECVGFTLRSYDPTERDRDGQPTAAVPLTPNGDFQPVTASLLRALPIVRHINVTRGSVYTTLEQMNSAPVAEPPKRRRLRHQLQDVYNPGSRMVGIDGIALAPSQALAEVARVYKAAVAGECRKPTKAVADAFHLSASAAAKRVSRARQAGFIPPATKKGKP